MQTTWILSALLMLTALAPAALADPTQGVAPHSVGDSPLDIHAVAVSTPHPYELYVSYEWTITVEGADTLAVHFERYDVNGYFSWWTNSCQGSLLTILDAHTDEVLDSYCGAQWENDFWTVDFPTDSVRLVLTTGGWEAGYGFDVYEVAANGARPVASVPYSSNPSIDAYPAASASVDPFAPENSAASERVSVVASWGDASLDASQSVEFGRFWDCSLFCEEVDGAAAGAALSLQVGDEWYLIWVDGSAVRDDGAPAGYAPGEVSFGCSRNGEAC